VLAALVPALAAGGTAVWLAVDAYQNTYTARLRDTARALALAIDAEIVGRIEALSAFAASPAFGDGAVIADFTAAHLHAGRVAAATGMRIAVGDAEGRFLLHHQVPPGAALPEAGAAGGVLREVVGEARPVVSKLILGPLVRQPVITVAVPVLRADGALPVFSVSGSLDPERFDALLAAQGLERGAFAVLVDAQGTIVGRSDGRFRGVTLPEETAALIAANHGGMIRRVGLDGQDRLFAIAALRIVPGWTVEVSVPYAAYRDSWARPLLGMTGGIALALALALALAGALSLLLARRLLRPVARLAEHARLIALDPEGRRGTAADLPPAPVAELDSLRRGFAAAEAALEARRRAERQAFATLAEKEAMLASAQQLTGVGGWTLELTDPADLDSCPLRWTEETYRIFGLAPASVSVSVPRVFEAIPAGDHARLRTALEAALQDGAPYRVEHRIIRPDGTVRLVEELASPERDAAGRVRRVFGACQDVTERRMVEAALAANAERLRDLLATLDLAAFMARDPDGTIRFWSAGCERLYGWSAAEALGRNVRDLLGTVFPVPPEQIEAMLAREGEWMGELRHRRRDGEQVVVAARMALRRDAAGRPVAVAESVAEVTALREAQEALAEGEARLRSVVDTALDAIVVAAEDGSIVFANHAAARMFGYPGPEALVGQDLGILMPAAEAARHPARLAAMARDPAMTARYMAPGRGLIARRADGAEFPIEASVAGFEAGGRRFVTGILRNVTERVTTEAALRESEAMLRRVLDNLFVFVGVLTPDGTVLDANRAPLEAAGLTLEEVRGRPFWDAYWWSHDPAAQARLREVCARAAAGEADRYDAEVRMAGDSRMVIDFQIAPLRDAAGRITHLIPSAVDITARKRSEEAKLLLAREVDHRAKNALAVVQSVLMLTRTEDPAAFKQAVTGRIAAMARAHTLLARERWHGADLRGVLAEELAAYRGAGGLDSAVQLDGPPVGLAPDAVQPVAMVIHELATNAAKYGALSAADGRVSVTWSKDAASGGLELVWREQGGPPVTAPPTRRGFGTSLIESTVMRQLQGRLDMAWAQEGLRCVLDLPARLVVWRGPAWGGPQSGDRLASQPGDHPIRAGRGGGRDSARQSMTCSGLRPVSNAIRCTRGGW
jgi:PAS domain S-box-containing protein